MPSEVEGKTRIEISETGIVTGNVYGGGSYLSEANEVEIVCNGYAQMVFLGCFGNGTVRHASLQTGSKSRIGTDTFYSASPSGVFAGGEVFSSYSDKEEINYVERAEIIIDGKVSSVYLAGKTLGEITKANVGDVSMKLNGVIDRVYCGGSNTEYTADEPNAALFSQAEVLNSLEITMSESGKIVHQLNMNGHNLHGNLLSNLANPSREIKLTDAFMQQVDEGISTIAGTIPEITIVQANSDGKQLVPISVKQVLTESGTLRFTGKGNQIIAVDSDFAGISILRTDMQCTESGGSLYVNYLDYEYFRNTQIARNNVCKSGATFYTGNLFPSVSSQYTSDQKTILEITSDGEWTLEFMTLDQAKLKKYTAPVTVDGSGPEVFIVRSPGKKISINYPTSDQFNFNQHFISDPQDDSAFSLSHHYTDTTCNITTTGPYKAETEINNAYELFVIQGSGEWSVEFNNPDQVAQVSEQGEVIRINGKGIGEVSFTKPVSLDDYPIMRINATCSYDDKTFTIFFTDNYGNSNSYSRDCASESVIYVGDLGLQHGSYGHKISQITVQAGDKWDLTLMPIDKADIPIFHAPCTVTGNSSQVFMVEDLGNIATISNASIYNAIQINPHDRFKTGPSFSGSGTEPSDYLISPLNNLFSFEVDGDWSIDFTSSEPEEDDERSDLPANQEGQLIFSGNGRRVIKTDFDLHEMNILEYHITTSESYIPVISLELTDSKGNNENISKLEGQDGRYYLGQHIDSYSFDGKVKAITVDSNSDWEILIMPMSEANIPVYESPAEVTNNEYSNDLFFINTKANRFSYEFHVPFGFFEIGQFNTANPEEHLLSLFSGYKSRSGECIMNPDYSLFYVIFRPTDYKESSWKLTFPEPGQLSTETKATVSDQSIKMNGTGLDSILIDFSLQKYRMMKFTTDCSADSWFSVTLYDEKGEHDSLYKTSRCLNKGTIFTDFEDLMMTVDDVSMVSVDAGDDVNWTLDFLTLEEAEIPVYSSPVEVSGSGPDIFRVENAEFGVADINDHVLKFFQYDLNDRTRKEDLLFLQDGPFRGNFPAYPGMELFSIDAAGDWKFVFFDSPSSAISEVKPFDVSEGNNIIIKGSGSGEIEKKADLNKYDIIRFDTTCQDEKETISIYAYDGEKYLGKIYNAVCTETGKSSISFLTYELNITKFEIETDSIDWTLSLLPFADADIKKYTAPISISGEGNDVFIVENAGDSLSSELDVNGRSILYQLDSDAQQGNVVFDIVGLGRYYGTTEIDPDRTLFEIDMAGEWEMDFR